VRSIVIAKKRSRNPNAALHSPWQQALPEVPLAQRYSQRHGA
jgi:hypothetical protein